MTNLSNPYVGVCGYCLGTFHLSGATDRPIRHGFNAYHIRHGQSGGYHTAPCRGISFDHFGKTTAGAEAALADYKVSLESVNKELARLATQPDLGWSYQETERAGMYSRNRKPVGERIERTLKPGFEGERIEHKSAHGYTTTLYVPSYQEQLDSQVREWTYHQRKLTEIITKFETAIKTWKPQDKVYQPTQPVVHLSKQYKIAYTEPAQTWDGPACRRNRYQDRFKYKLGDNLTSDKSKVTCQSCKKH